MRALLTLPTLALALAAAWPARAANEADAALNNKAVQAYNDGDYESAIVSFAQLADEATSEDVRLKSEYYLAQSYFKRGLYNAALNQFSYVVKAGPNHPHYLKSIEGIVGVSEVLDEDFITGTVLDREYNDEFAKLPLEVLNKINYIVGMVSYRKNKRDDAVSFLTSVPADSSYFARSKYLLGVILARNGENDRALEAFNEVLKLMNSPKLAYLELAEVQQLARLGLARVYFGMGRYADAVKQYEAVPRFSEYWDEALFENGWARMQNDDIGGALGSLQALHAPQFAGSFQPESWILKATVYYFSCLFDDAKRALEGFEKVYLPVNERLKPLLEGELSNADWFALLGEGSDKLPRNVKNYLVANKRLVQFKAYIEQLGRERELIQGSQALKGGKLQTELLGSLEQSRDLAVQMTGSFVKRRLDDASKMIASFDSQKEIIRFEVAKGETSLLESRLDQGKFLGDQGLYRPAMPGTNWEYWQFQGEFWLDEIGYYQYTLKSGCMKKDE